MSKIPPPETVAHVRLAYSEGVRVRTIMAETGVAQSTVYACLAGKYDDGSGAPPAPIQLRNAYGGPGSSRRALGRKAMIRGLWRTASQQVQQIEDVLAQHGREPAARDNSVRTLAALVKTLRELSAFDEAQAAKRTKRKKPEPADDDPVPRDIDEFRRELARRMDAFVDRKLAARRGAGPGTSGPGVPGAGDDELA